MEILFLKDFFARYLKFSVCFVLIHVAVGKSKGGGVCLSFPGGCMCLFPRGMYVSRSPGGRGVSLSPNVNGYLSLMENFARNTFQTKNTRLLASRFENGSVRARLPCSYATYVCHLRLYDTRVCLDMPSGTALSRFVHYRSALHRTADDILPVMLMFFAGRCIARWSAIEASA